MSIFFVNTQDAQISNAFLATLGAAPGSTFLAQIKAAGLIPSVQAMINATGSSTAAALSTKVATNLGLTGTALTGGTAYLDSVTFAGASSTWAANLMSTLDLFSTLQSDATYGSAATAYLARVNSAVSYSVVATNNSTDLPTLAAAVGSAGSTGGGSTFTLTTGVDNRLGTLRDDSFSGVNSANATEFATLDVIDGGPGVDTLSLGLIAAYTGGATIRNIEKIVINQTVAGGFNATGITGLTDFTTNASTVDIALTNLASAANIGIQNQDTVVTVTYADAAVAGAADSVKLTLSNVAQAANTAIALNNTTATAGATGIETLTIDLAGNVGGTTAAFSATIDTNATASLSSVVITGAAAGALTMGTNVTTTATTIDASAATGAVTLAGIGAAVHTITMGSGNDSVNMGGNLTAADTVNGGGGTDTIASTAANFNTLNTAGTVLATVTNFETLRVTDDAAANTTINAALVGAVNLRVATQTGAQTLTVNNLGGSTGTSNIRIDAAVGAGGAITFNLKDATLPATANTVNLDLRGTAATHTFTMQGVETVNANTSNAVTSTVLAMTNAALTTLNITNTSAATFDTGTLGANVSTVDASGVTGAGAVTITLNGTAATGAIVTGSRGADTITGSNQLDIINSGAGNDVIIASAGADRINVGAGNDTYQAVDAATLVGVIATGGSVANADKITGMGNNDIINFAGITSITTGTTDGAIAVGVTFATAAADQAVLVSGSYNAATDIFTAGAASATNNDYLFQFTGGAAATDINTIVLIDIVGTLTATSLTEVVTLSVV